MSDQLRLRRRIASLERLQRQRIELVERQKKQLDDSIERADREIRNLKQQLTIGMVNR